MKIKTLQRKIKKLYPSVVVDTKDGCVHLTGTLDNRDDIVNAGYMSVDKKRYLGVLNDIKLKGFEEPKIRIPKTNDTTLDGLRVDCLVIGGGISGTSILRELTRYNISALLVEKESDLAMQASGRNDGEVHPGVDLNKGSKKQYYVVRSNPEFGNICKELDVDFVRRGQYACFDKPINPLLKLYAKFRSMNGCPTTVANKKEIEEKETHFTKKVKCAISNPQSGVVSPYELTIAFAENAVSNGAKVSLDTAILDIEVKGDKIISVKTNKGTIYPKVVINAAGCFSDKIADMANDRFFTIHPRSGTDFIFDNKISGQINHISSFVGAKKNKKKHSKGGGIVKTIDNNILIGPNAYETPYREDYSVLAGSLDEIIKKQERLLPSLNKKDIIAYFTGTRAATYEEDFYINKGRKTKNIVHCAGIQSPGLTTAPLVAKDVSKMAIEELSEVMKVEENKSFNPIRKKDPILRKLSSEERNALIKKNPSYGRIVCRCEQISEGEIIDCLNRNIKVPTINGIKRRVRPGMGRCQGGFCMPLVAKIISDHEKFNIYDVKGKQSDYPVTFKSNKRENHD
jgi:glycerol-3-phosphate dehydrogenase